MHIRDRVRYFYPCLHFFSHRGFWHWFSFSHKNKAPLCMLCALKGKSRINPNSMPRLTTPPLLCALPLTQKYAVTLTKKNHCHEFINNLKNRWFHTPGIWLDSFESIDDRLKCWLILVQASTFTCTAYILKSVKSIDLTPPLSQQKLVQPPPLFISLFKLVCLPCLEATTV